MAGNQAVASTVRRRPRRKAGGGGDAAAASVTAAASTAGGGGAGGKVHGTSPPDPFAHGAHPPPGGWRGDVSSIALFTALYFLQGIPMGVTFGAIPFLLKASATPASYASLGLFSFAGWPYSLKLGWSPLVDGLHWAPAGRRRSWVLPVQAVCGGVLLACAGWVEAAVERGAVGALTAFFFGIVGLAATQDIAVDGWALSRLRQRSYGSVCQSVGLTAGYFSAFTVFLSLNNADFCDRYVHPALARLAAAATSAPALFPLGGGGGRPAAGALLSLAGLLRAAGCAYLLVTVVVLVWVPEEPSPRPPRGSGAVAPATGVPPPPRDALCNNGGSGGGGDGDDSGGRSGGDGSDNGGNGGVGGGHVGGDSDDGVAASPATVYAQLAAITRLPAIRHLCVLLLASKLPFAAHDGATALKLLDAGVPKADLAAMAALHVPLELGVTLVAGRAAAGGRPSVPFLTAYRLRLVLAALSPVLVAAAAVGVAPDGTVARWYWWSIFAVGAAYQAGGSAGMFVSMGAFFASIGDEGVGGTYLTLLNTVNNGGGTWPRAPVLAAIEAATVRSCGAGGGGGDAPTAAAAAATATAAAAAAGCTITRDGYYLVSAVLVAAGVPIYWWVLRRWLPVLEALPREAWRVGRGGRRTPTKWQ
ncbi:hypothetical protein MMPV_003448 [Pyropia vietnamensis]